MNVKAKFKWSFYRPGVAQSVCRDILYSSMTAALGGGKWSAARHSRTLPRENAVPILQEAGWGRKPVWMGGISRPHRDWIPERPARSQTLYRLSYRAAALVNEDIKLQTD